MIVIDCESMVVKVLGFIRDLTFLWKLDTQYAHGSLEVKCPTEFGFV